MKLDYNTFSKSSQTDRASWNGGHKHRIAAHLELFCGSPAFSGMRGFWATTCAAHKTEKWAWGASIQADAPFFGVHATHL
jgi:hypothetical protein